MTKGLALSHLADRAGIARSYLWLLLDGAGSVTLATVQRLADVLGVEPLELLTGGATTSARVAAEPKAERPAPLRKPRCPRPTSRRR